VKRSNDINRIEQYRQNRLFENNQKLLFEQLEGKEREDDAIPDADASKRFWKGIWEKEVKHKEDAEWINEIETEVSRNLTNQNELTVTTEILKKQANKLSNWKSPGPDGVQGYWIKNLTSLHPLMTALFNECLISGDFPKWLTEVPLALS